MSGDIIERPDRRSFDEFKHVNDHGAEYWNARELQSLLGYAQWRSFENAIKKAVTSGKQSGNEPGYHFARAQNGRAWRATGFTPVILSFCARAKRSTRPRVRSAR